MKSLLNVISILFIAVAVSLSAQAKTGNEGSGGGDLRAMQFVKVADKIAEYLENGKNPPNALKEIDLKALRQAIDKTTVESTSEVLSLPSGESVSAVTKDALNWFSKKRIVFNREAWDVIPDGSRRAALVLHEYLGIMGIDDQNYGYSRLLFENPGLKILFDNIPETQEITEGLDFDFAVKCTIDFRGRHIDEFDPLGWRIAPNGQIAQYSGLIGRTLTRQGDEFLELLIYDESNPDLGLFGIPVSHEKAIHFVLGWEKSTFFNYPERVIFDQKVKLTPNFKSQMDFPELDLKYECHRMLQQELNHQPFYIPVSPFPSQS